MLGISVIRFPGIRCVKKYTKALTGFLSSDGVFVAMAIVIFLFLLISFSFRRLAFGNSTPLQPAEQHDGKYNLPIISHKQLMEFQSPGKTMLKLFKMFKIAK